MATELFAGPAFRAFEIGEADLEGLQRFFDENPAYFHVVGGEDPRPGQAREEFDDRPPADWPWDGKWMIRFADADGATIAVADIVSNLLARGVWHVGLFIAATRLHGSGTARRLYDGLESWAGRGGARGRRPHVGGGNARAARLWEKKGYVEVRRRAGIEIGRRVNTMRVMVKPLAGEGVPAYLAQVPRDRPGSP